MSDANQNPGSYVQYDSGNGSIMLELPAEARAEGSELMEELYSAFAFEGINTQILKEMNVMAGEWLVRKGYRRA